MPYFVYVLMHPLTEEAAYIGMTNNLYARFKAHLSDKNKESAKVLWIKDLKQKSLIPSMRVIECLDTLKGARQREKYWIQYYLNQGVLLTNRTHIPLHHPVSQNVIESGFESLGDGNDRLSTADIKREYGISNMVVRRRMKEGILLPLNASPVLYRQHRLFFHRKDVERLFEKRDATSTA